MSCVDVDDRQLMLRVQLGEGELFDHLAARYRDRLLRFAASKLGDDARAEDVVQETFLAAFAARHTYDGQFAFSTWVWTILINLCRREHRRRARRPDKLMRPALADGSEAPMLEPAHNETGLSRLLLSEQREQLEVLLDELSDVQADALRLRFYGGLQYNEIAQTMNCSLSGAKRRVRTGLLALAERLGESNERGDVP